MTLKDKILIRQIEAQSQPQVGSSRLLGGGVLVKDWNGTEWHVWETQGGRDEVWRCLCYNPHGTVTVIPRHQLQEVERPNVGGQRRLPETEL